MSEKFKGALATIFLSAIIFTSGAFGWYTGYSAAQLSFLTNPSDFMYATYESYPQEFDRFMKERCRRIVVSPEIPIH